MSGPVGFETLRLAVEGGVATLMLSRPEAMNAITQRMKDELALALDAIDADDAIRAVIVTGDGDKAFSAGADIKERAGQEPTPAEFVSRQGATHRLFDRIAGLPQPVIAAINGVALGGGAEIALCADIRLMAAHASIGFTEVNLGVIPAGGGTQRLPRIVGTARAKELIITGARIGAAEAAAIALVNRVVEGPRLRDEAAMLATAIAAKPPLAVRHAKQAIDRGIATDLASGLAIELDAASILFASEDRKEGMRAFVEKRAPLFKGR